MTQRHLLPSEIDLLVEGDPAPGLAELQAHVDACAACRRRVREGKLIATTLETMIPHAKPRPGFADRIMGEVAVSQPWYAAAASRAAALLPQTPRGRWAIGALAVAGSAALLAVGGWLAMRADGAALIGATAIDRARVDLASASGDALGALFGEGAVSALRDGGLPAFLAGAGVFLGALAAATAGFSALAGVSRRRQEGRR